MNFDYQLLEYFRKNRRLATSVAIFVSILMVLYAFLGYSPKYTSDAKVLIRESVLTSKYITTDVAETTSSALTNPILNNMNLLKTSAISDGLWEYMSKYRKPFLEEKHIHSKSDWEEFFMDGSSLIKAKNVPGTDIIALSFQWNDPIVSKEGLDVVLKSFQNASLKINQSEQMERSEYLLSQAGDLRDRLAMVRSKIRDFKKKQGTVNIAKDTENYSKSRIDFETALRVTQAEARAKSSELAGYQSTLGMSSKQALQSTAIGGDPTVMKLYDQLYSLKEQQSQNRARYTDKHPVMQQLASQISQIEHDLQSQVQRNTGRTMPAGGKQPLVVADETRFGAIKNMVQAKSEAAALAAKSSLLNRYLKELDQKMSALPQAEATLAKYQDEENVLSASLNTLEQKAMEAKIRALQSLSNVYIIDPARMPKNPSFPAPIHICVLGVLLGVALGFAAVFLKMKLEQFFGREFVVGVPTFATVVGTMNNDSLGLPKNRSNGSNKGGAIADHPVTPSPSRTRSTIPNFYSKI